jgi:hypothetical protein
LSTAELPVTGHRQVQGLIIAARAVDGMLVELTARQRMDYLFVLAPVYKRVRHRQRNVMGHNKTVVDASAPAAITAAIMEVKSTPGLRIQPGIDALWKIFQAANHSMPRAELEKQFGALDLHFGWFCRRVAEQLGANEPDAFALVDHSTDANGDAVLTLKPAVVSAMVAGIAGRRAPD